MKVLITGGAGYIGSTTASALEQAGHTPVILDSLLTGQRQFAAGRLFFEGDIADRALVERVFDEHPDIAVTVHMAARIVVPESVAQPYDYYRDNVAKSLTLFDTLAQLGRPDVVFSSSASIYAPTDDFTVVESSPLAPASPYARTKMVMEMVMEDLAAAGRLRALALRYFNPIGSDPELRSGVHVREPSHVLGQLVRAALGQQDAFRITGVDLPTRDGTGLRDYVHVWDLARAHVAAVERFDDVLSTAPDGFIALNVGTGEGVTVRELVAAFERVFGRPVPVVEAPPRVGDAIGAYARVERIRELTGWRSDLGLEDGIASALAWAERRPEVLGYA